MRVNGGELGPDETVKDVGKSREPVEMKKEEEEGGGVNHRLDMLLRHKSKPSSWIGRRARLHGGIGLAL